MQSRLVHVFGNQCHSETQNDGASLSRQCFLITEIGKASGGMFLCIALKGKEKKSEK